MSDVSGASGRKLSELVLPTTRMFPIPGRQSVWKKTGVQEILPLNEERWVFQVPARRNLILDRLEILAADPITEEIGDTGIRVNGQRLLEDNSIFDPADSAFAVQTRHQDKLALPGEALFEIFFTNPGNVFAIHYEVSLRIFMERIAN